VLDLVANNIVEKSGAWYAYAGERIGQGRKHPHLPQGQQGHLRKMDAELRKKLGIGGAKADVPEVQPPDG